MRNITKQADVQGLGQAGLGDLEQINALARRELTADEVYLFAVRLCDNDVDRDGERFAVETLEELGKLFVGVSGVFDHQWSARGQTARIYRTEVVHEEGTLTQDGQPYCYLKGYAYMMRTEDNAGLIAEIDGGIKREVSVGCAVERAVCSICGGDLRTGDCGHRKGQEYGGRLCFASLEGASDAYEFSFVAVPAQPLAGVVKGAGRHTSLKELVRQAPGCALELERLEEEAETGRRYLSRLREEVVRLGMLAQIGLDRDTLKGVAAKLSWEELLAMEDGCRRRAAERYPLLPQLQYQQDQAPERDRDRAFLI